MHFRLMLLACVRISMLTHRVLVCVTSQYTPDQMAGFKSRLGKLTLYVGPRGFSLTAPDTCDISQEPHILRQAMKVIGSARWELVNCSRAQFELRGWHLTPELVGELYALPVFDGPTELVVRCCVWSRGQSYEGLSAVLPASYDTVASSGRHGDIKAEEVMSLCLGCRGRSTRLRVGVDLGDDFKYADWLQVEAYIEREGLGRWCELVWDHRSHCGNW